MKLLEIKEAIYDRLESVLDVGIYDYLPSEERPPFVVMEEMEFDFPDHLSSKFDEAYLVQQALVVVTEAEGKYQAVEIVKKIKKAFGKFLEIEGELPISQKLMKGKIYEADDGLYIARTGVELWMEEEE